MEMDIKQVEEDRPIDSIGCTGRHKHCFQSCSGHCYRPRSRYNLVEKGTRILSWLGHTLTYRHQALKGSTVEDLHKSWSFSTSVLELLTAGRSFNLVALAALTAKFALVDNLLLQKAAGTSPSTYEQSGIKLRLPAWQQQLPANYVGTFSADGKIGAFTSNFSSVLHDYNTYGAFIRAEDFDYLGEFTSTCTGECFVTVPGYVLLFFQPLSSSLQLPSLVNL